MTRTIQRLSRGFGALLIVMGLICVPISSAIVTPETMPKRVLLISSYSPSFQTFFQQIQGIRDTFDDDAILFDVEFMDSKRLFTEENYANFYQSLTYKLDQLPPYDLVMTSDDNALNFIREHQETLFPDTPIVFLGVNNLESASLANSEPMITGVVEATSILETITAAMALQPEAKRVVALVDTTTSGQSDLTNYYGFADELEQIELTDIDLSDMTYDGYAKALSALTKNDIVLLLSVYSDITNQRLTFDEGLALTLEHCPQPVYHPYLHGIGDGLVGGKVISHYEQGRAAADIAVKILHGTDVSTIPVVMSSPNAYVYDYNVLQAYELPISQLPYDAELLGYQPSIFEQYAAYIIGAVLILLLEMTIILLLIRANRDRRVAEKGLLASNSELHDANQHLAETNEELMTAYDELENQSRTIHELIYVDSLTGLSNRFAISEEIKETTQNPSDNIDMLLFIDVDNFKNINDTFGHDFGDMVIQQTGLKLKSLESKDMMIGRFGGDEFIILCRNLPDSKDVDSKVEAIKSLFDSSIIINGIQLFLTVSIGVVLHPTHGDNETELMKKADLALYEAKRRGKDRYILFDTSMSMDLEGKLRFQTELKKAVANQSFYLNYQPIIHTYTGDVRAFEALIRWKSPIYGQVSPIKLIENAEELGLIVEIGDMVLRKACRFISGLRMESGKDIKVSVNVSPMQLVYDDFYQRVIKIMDEENCGPDAVAFEMTETALIKSLDTALDTIEALRTAGYGMSLDDFGTGYSSLRYFKDLPISCLKIDKAFIQDIATGSYKRKFVQSILLIAKEKGIPVVAEGVENEEDYTVLRSIGCDSIQGYYFSKPLDEADAIDYMVKQQKAQKT